MGAFVELQAVPPHRIWEGVSGRIVEGERITFALIELEPDTVVPEHSHEQEQVGILVGGSLTFRIGEETRTLGPGGGWRILAGTPHQVTTGPRGAVVAEAFSPTRDDWAGLERGPAGPPLPLG